MICVVVIVVQFSVASVVSMYYFWCVYFQHIVVHERGRSSDSAQTTKYHLTKNTIWPFGQLCCTRTNVKWFIFGYWISLLNLIWKFNDDNDDGARWHRSKRQWICNKHFCTWPLGNCVCVAWPCGCVCTWIYSIQTNFEWQRFSAAHTARRHHFRQFIEQSEPNSRSNGAVWLKRFFFTRYMQINNEMYSIIVE